MIVNTIQQFIYLYNERHQGLPLLKRSVILILLRCRGGDTEVMNPC
jgi:hypothetical protein